MAAMGLLHLCKTYRTLPQAGGLLDQDSLLVHLLAVYDLASNERVERDAKRNRPKSKGRGFM